MTPEQSATSFEPVWAIGLMTGTVLDGHIDVALIKTDGVRIVESAGYELVSYEPGMTELLAETLSAALEWEFNGPEPELFRRAESVLTRTQSNAVMATVEGFAISMQDISVVGFHGQTVLHRPPQSGAPGRTRQLGDGQMMAELLGVPVAFDFRSADVAAGGQGAPLAAIYHTALLRELSGMINTDGAESNAAGINGSEAASLAVLNLGGVSNITWWDGADTIIAFDTGPANAPINDFVRQCGLGEMDRDGELAAGGAVDEEKLALLLDHPYLSREYPKSLDRFDFTKEMASGMNPEDGAALLTAFSAAAIGRALDLLPTRPRSLIVCGGGRHNPTLMDAIGNRASVAVFPAELVGWRGDATEAECFAFLAVRTLRGLPISFPSTTGVPGPMPGGRLAIPGASG